MLTIFDLYDLHQIFINIRNHADNVFNLEVVKCVMKIIKSKNSKGELNSFRVALRSIEHLDEAYSFIWVSNYYTYIPYFIKDDFVYDILLESCNEFLNVIHLGDIERVADLADSLHNLPILLADHQLSIPKIFWEVDVQLYRKKWNNTFLQHYQKR